MKFSQVMSSAGEWLRGEGPHHQVVVSSRVRLARNLRHRAFPGWAKKTERTQVLELVKPHVEALPEMQDSFSELLQDLSALEKQVLVERHLISREHAAKGVGSAVVMNRKQTLSIMINEEDHLRMQVMHSGLDMEQAWEQINTMDDRLSERVDYAFHKKLGYLTACPTNVGTGMRVSVMLHLPALVITQQIEKVFRSLQKMGLAVRGLYGEGSQAMGDFYQISNQITLGRSEIDLVKQVGEVIPVIIDYERQARAFLVKESRKDLHDRVSRAYGILCTAQTISSEETLHLLSSVRMGVYLGLIQDLEIPTINKLFIHTQPAHLQKLRGAELPSADRNVERAMYLQTHLRKRGNNNGGASDN
jgi:protein arginine kinase